MNTKMIQPGPVQSVIIPTFNRKNMLAEAIDSVLKQTQKSLEVIIIDDCSTDGTEELVKSITDERVRYFKNEENSGSEFSRNFGLKHARGKYITFLDDDDYYTDFEFFRKAVSIFENNECTETPLAIVCADGKILDTESDQIVPRIHNKPGRVKGIDFILNLGRDCTKPTSLFPAVFNADILRQSGIDNIMIFDTETYMWAALHGDVYVMEDTTVGIYRIHPIRNSFGRKYSSNWMQKRLSNLDERIKIERTILERLYERSNRREAKIWYVTISISNIYFFIGNNMGFIDRLKIYFYVLEGANFMPELCIKMPYIILRCELRNIKFLRKIYRALKYKGM